MIGDKYIYVKRDSYGRDIFEKLIFVKETKTQIVTTNIEGSYTRRFNKNTKLECGYSGTWSSPPKIVSFEEYKKTKLNQIDTQLNKLNDEINRLNKIKENLLKVED